MALWIAIGVIVVMVFVFWVVMARDPGPTPADVATAYEAAWDRLDFSTLFDLSGDELRDGMTRARYVTAMRAAHPSPPPRRVDDIAVETSDASGDTAHVVTLLRSEGSVIPNDLILRRRGGRWVVTGYGIRPDPTAQ